MAASIVAGEITVSTSGAGLTASAAGVTDHRGLISPASAGALVRERTTNPLFDIPCLEFYAPIQIHAKTGRDVKRLEKTDDRRIFNRAHPGMTGEPKRTQIAPRVAVRMRRKPNLQKKQADEQRELSCPESLGLGARHAPMPSGELAHPRPQYGPPKAPELNEGLRERPGRSQSAQRDSGGQLVPPYIGACAPHLERRGRPAAPPA